MIKIKSLEKEKSKNTHQASELVKCDKKKKGKILRAQNFNQFSKSWLKSKADEKFISNLSHVGTANHFEMWWRWGALYFELLKEAIESWILKIFN